MVKDADPAATVRSGGRAYPGSVLIEGLENAAWDDAGHPTNLNAAVVDGLEWLAMFRMPDLNDEGVDRRDDIARALDDKAQAEDFPMVEVFAALLMRAAILGLAWLIRSDF